MGAGKEVSSMFDLELWWRAVVLDSVRWLPKVFDRVCYCKGRLEKNEQCVKPQTRDRE